jgi:hypothetical protein
VVERRIIKSWLHCSNVTISANRMHCNSYHIRSRKDKRWRRLRLVACFPTLPALHTSTSLMPVTKQGVLRRTSHHFQVKVKVKIKVILPLASSQYVLVSSPLWDSCPDIRSCLTVTVLSLCSTLSDERSGLSPVSHCQQY